jgi:hypothetical protein
MRPFSSRTKSSRATEMESSGGRETEGGLSEESRSGEGNRKIQLDVKIELM